MHEVLRRHLLMLSEWWGWDEDDGQGRKLMTHAPLSRTKVVHAILSEVEGESLPSVLLFSTSSEARKAWDALHER